MLDTAEYICHYTGSDVRKISGGYESVRVIEDTGTRIVLQHLLVTGEKSDKVGTYAVSAAGALKRVGEAASGKGALWIEVLHTSAN